MNVSLERESLSPSVPPWSLICFKILKSGYLAASMMDINTMTRQNNMKYQTKL